MAVADVAVAFGPRNRRRLTRGAIVLGLVAVGATAALLLRPTHHAGSSLSGGSTHAATPALLTSKIVYGMSKQQVLRRVGQPAKTVGPCWQYNVNHTIRGGQNMLNATRVCFLGGRYSYDYSEMDGKWFYPTTPLNLR